MLPFLNNNEGLTLDPTAKQSLEEAEVLYLSPVNPLMLLNVI